MFAQDYGFLRRLKLEALPSLIEANEYDHGVDEDEVRDVHWQPKDGLLVSAC